MAVEQETLRAREPVGEAIGMSPAGLDKTKSRIGEQCRNGAAQEIRRRYKIGVEDRNIGCIRMLEAECEIAGLEADSLTAMKHAQRDAFRHHFCGGFGQRLVFVRGAVVEQLDFETIMGPVEARGRSGDAQRQISFIANRQLDEDTRQRFFGKQGNAQRSGGPEKAQQRQCTQLRRKEREEHQNAGKKSLQQ
jgi:hypothetical protein